MKLSAQEEYGLRCLVKLGHAGDGASLTLAELSRSEGISVPNVAKMMRLLRRAGIVTSTRGKEGGYTLARAPEQISVAETMAVLGGRIFDKQFCERHSGAYDLCAHTSDCSIRPVWRTIQEAIDAVLVRMTLRDLLRNEADMKAWVSPRAVPLPVVPLQGRIS